MLKRLFGRGGPVSESTTATESTIDQMLARVADGSHPYAIVHLDDERNWYLQVSLGDAGLITEAVSNAYLKGSYRLTPEDEDGLRRLGWSQASPQDNWTRMWPGWPSVDREGPRDLLLGSLPMYRRAVGDPVTIEYGT